MSISQKKIKLSVVLAVFNEEKNLGKCLETVKNLADEIIIVDGGSIDKTIKIAREYGAKVIVTDNPPVFHINKQKAIDACSGEWILQLDADERVTPSLKQEISEAIKERNDETTAYYLPRKNYFLGHWMKKGGLHPDYVIRLFQKDKAYLPCKSVHEQMKVKGRVGYFKNELLHYPYPVFSEYLRKANYYTTLTALEYQKQKIGKGILTIMRYCLILSLRKFFSLYIRHKGFQDGFPGFAWAFFSSLHPLIAYIKYWEMENEK